MAVTTLDEFGILDCDDGITIMHSQRQYNSCLAKACDESYQTFQPGPFVIPKESDPFMNESSHIVLVVTAIMPLGSTHRLCWHYRPANCLLNHYHRRIRCIVKEEVTVRVMRATIQEFTLVVQSFKIVYLCHESTMA